MRRFLAVLFVLFSFCANAQPTIPGTQAGKVLDAWLSAFNSGDRVRLEQFASTYGYTPSVDGILNYRKYIGGYSLLRIEKSEPLSVTALLAERDFDYLSRRVFTLRQDDPSKLLAATSERISRPPDLAIPRLTQEKALKAMSARGDAAASEDRFSGALLIARHGQILLEKTWGLANRETKEQISPDTKFRLASASKMFTAVAVLQLVNTGKVSLDGTVGMYLTDYPNRDVASKVTVRELLTHTGGTGDIFGPEYVANRATLKTHADYMRLYGARGPSFEPGSKDAYSNYGFVLLGLIVERLSGTSYYDYVKEHVFVPAGMKDTDFLPETEVVPHLSTGYTWRDTGWTPNLDFLPYRGTAAGGGYSTIRDLLRFAAALESGKLLPMQVFADATSPQNHGGWYGLGFQTEGDGTMMNFGHDGGAPGMNSEFRVFPKLGIVAIGLSNLDPPAAESLINFYIFRMPADAQAR